MIRIVTLNNDKKEIGSSARLRELTKYLRLAEIDILCCQGMQRTLDGRHDPAREIAESLQMTYFFSATDRTGGGEKDITFTGISILAGAYVWMLNSGTFALPGGGPDKKQAAQFAVIRQNDNWVLVVNAEFSPVASTQLQQLQTVFSHPRLQERYGAVILCSNRNLTVSKQDLQSATALSAYKLANETKAMSPAGDTSAIANPACDQSCPGHPVDGVIFTLIARNTTPATFKIHGASAALLLDSVLSSEFEIKQKSVENKNKFFLPLSYSEQWPGVQGADHKL